MRTVKVKDLTNDETEIIHKKSWDKVCVVNFNIADGLYPKMIYSAEHCRRLAAALTQAADEMEGKKK